MESVSGTTFCTCGGNPLLRLGRPRSQTFLFFLYFGRSRFGFCRFALAVAFSACRSSCCLILKMHTSHLSGIRHKRISDLMKTWQAPGCGWEWRCSCRSSKVVTSDAPCFKLQGEDVLERPINRKDIKPPQCFQCLGIYGSSFGRMHSSWLHNFLHDT